MYGQRPKRNPLSKKIEKIHECQYPAEPGVRSLGEATPPGYEQWIRDRKAEFKDRYGEDWESKLYATAWAQYNAEHGKS